MRPLLIAPSILAADFGRLAEEVRSVLHLCDVVLSMTVNPGFGGQAFLPEMLPKIRDLRRLCDSRRLDRVIAVDRGITTEHVRRVVDAGADAIIACSTAFGSPHYGAVIADLRRHAWPMEETR